MPPRHPRGPAFIEILVILALAATIISVLLQRR
jgi:type II secretory pathway component PulK